MADSQILWIVAHQGSLSTEFFSQEYWTRLSFPPPGNLPNAGIKSVSHVSPALHLCEFFTHRTIRRKQNKTNQNPRWHRGFPDSSVGKQSSCNAGDPSSIPNSGWSGQEGIRYPLQYSWASLVAQLLKNSPAMWETWVWSFDWKDPLEKGMATHSRILAWRTPWTV